jgi:hypothetical protein
MEIKNSEQLISFLNSKGVLAKNLYPNYMDYTFEDKVYKELTSYQSSKEAIALKELYDLGFRFDSTESYNGYYCYTIIYHPQLNFGIASGLFYSSWDDGSDFQFSDWFEVELKEVKVKVIKFYNKENNQELRPHE